MFLLSVDNVCMKTERKAVLASGAQNVYLCQFVFSPEWEGLDKTAVFQAQNVKVSVVLDEEGKCRIPYEVLVKPYVKLFAGVYGTKNGELIMPTVIQDLGRIEKGVSLGEEAREPTPDLYSQILANSNEALEAAREVKATAAAGGFDGLTPEIGGNGNWFIGGVDTGKPSKGKDGFGAGDVGESGATFTPSVDGGGNLSWSNDKGLENPATVNIKGPKGEPGEKGEAGTQGVPGPKGDQGEPGEKGDTPVIGDNGNWYIGGVDTGKPSRGAPGASSGEGGTGENGATFVPALDENGNLSWSNDKGLDNPAAVNIKGLKGDQGEKGEKGDQGIPGEQGIQGQKGDPGTAGAPGAKGDKGDPGTDGAPGEKGADGYTPVKGTDYWTAADKAEMVQAVLAALPDGDEVSY